MAEPPGTSVIAWQNAASPLVMGDFIYVNGNVPGQRLAAVRKADGVTAWARHDLGMTHATPAWAVIAGAPQVVFVTAQGLAGLAPASGDVLWRYVFTPSSTSTAVTPVVAGDRVYASAAYGRGSWNARIVPAGGAFSAVETQYRQATEFQNHWATPVHHEGVLYGIVERGAPARSLVCYDLAGRTNRWRTTAVGSGSPGFGSVIKAGGLLLVLTEEGELVLVQPDPERYVELGRFPLLTRHCWNNPAFSGGRLYARSSAELAALDLAPEAAPLPPLAVSAGLAREPLALRFSVTGQDRPLPADAAGRLELASTSALPAADAAWTPVTAAFTVQDGVAEASVPLPGGDTFFRVRTRP
jgi:outer membrane protein assembly factor BamB